MPGTRVLDQIELGVRQEAEEDERFGGRAEKNEPRPLRDVLTLSSWHAENRRFLQRAIVSPRRPMKPQCDEPLRARCHHRAGFRRNQRNKLNSRIMREYRLKPAF